MESKVVKMDLIITFGITWGLGGVFLIANQFGYLKFGTPLSWVLFIIATIAPAIASFIILITNNVITMKDLLKATFAIKQPVAMYLLVIGFVVIYLGVAVLTGLLEYNYPIYLSLLNFPIMILAGGLEEVGWRYVLNPALEKRLPFPVACLITGVVWSVWHLPAFIIENSPQADINFFIFAIISIGVAFAYAAIYRISKSIWLCVFIHALNNALYGSFILKMDRFDTAVVPAIIIAVVLIIVSIFIVNIMEKNKGIESIKAENNK
jgi:membrane protease YdiL (CAAX protease family)